MKKAIKSIVIFIMVIITISTVSVGTVFAHSLTPRANLYTVNNAGGNYQFAIGDYAHVDGSALKYY